MCTLVLASVALLTTFEISSVYAASAGTLPDPPKWKLVTHSHIPETEYEPVRNLTGRKFWDALQPSFVCPAYLLTHVGHPDESGKLTCGLINLAHNSYQPSPKTTKCVTYAFGSETDPSFEAEVLEMTHCEVFIHDEKIDRIMPPLHPNNPRVHIKKMDVIEEQEGNDTASQVKRSSAMSTSILQSMTEHGHNFLDIVRMDVEGHEFNSLDKLLEDFEEIPIGQLIVMFHILEWTQENVDKLIDLLQRLENKGFRLFAVNKNMYNKDCCEELSFMNIHSTELFLGFPNIVQRNGLH